MARSNILLASPEEQQTMERPAATSAAIKAGMLLGISSGEFIKHATSGGAVPVLLVADREEAQDIETAYSDGDNVKALVNPKGFWGILASGQNLADGASLMSNGAGLLTGAGSALSQAVDEGGTATYTIHHSKIVGILDGAVNATSGNTRCKVISAR